MDFEYLAWGDTADEATAISHGAKAYYRMGLRRVAFQFFFRTSVGDCHIASEPSVDIRHKMSELRSMAGGILYSSIAYREMDHLMNHYILQYGLFKVISVAQCQMVDCSGFAESMALSLELPHEGARR